MKIFSQFINANDKKKVKLREPVAPASLLAGAQVFDWGRTPGSRPNNMPGRRYRHFISVIRIGSAFLNTAGLFLSVLFLFPGLSPASSDPLKDLPQRVKKIILPNGLRVLIVERPASPTVSFATYIRTGGLDDEMGKSGLAHMFEHMLFKGTKTINTKNYAKEAPLLAKIDAIVEKLQSDSDEILPTKKMPEEKRKSLEADLERLSKEHAALMEEEEFWKIYERAGGNDLNASTGYDFTNYTISLPSNYLELWAKMESDRIANPVLREFYKERSVVLEERRMRVDNSPQGKLWESFLGTAFLAHPYGRPIVGWESDVSRVTRKDAETFFKTHYGIDRLVMAVVGGVKASEIETLLQKYFKPIKSEPHPNLSRIPVEPTQEGERRVSVQVEAEPSLVMGFHRPNMQHPDEAALGALAEILSQGRTGRLYQNIVEKKKMGLSLWASGSFPGERDPNLFVIGGQPRPPFTIEDLEKAIFEEIELLKKEPPTDEELARVKTNLESDLIRGLSSNKGMASQLAYYEAVGGDWNFLLKAVDQLRALTPKDVQAVAQKYLLESNRTVGVIIKKK